MYWTALQLFQTNCEFINSSSEVYGDFVWRWNVTPSETWKISFHAACGCFILFVISRSQLLAVFSRRVIRVVRNLHRFAQVRKWVWGSWLRLMAGRSRKSKRNIPWKSARQTSGRFRRLFGYWECANLHKTLCSLWIAFPGIFTVQCCCRHPKILGLLVIDACEGFSTALSIPFSRFRTIPLTVFYDNACNLSRSVTIRIPWLHNEVRFVSDRLHYRGHKCSSVHDPDFYPGNEEFSMFGA